MSPDQHHVALSPRDFRMAILAVMLTILLGALDQMIVSVAVPTIARDLGGAGWMAWIISGYLVASTVVTPLYGRFSDTHGKRAVLTAALLVYIAASVASALSQTLPQLVLERVLQGIGGGGLIVLAQSVVADIVPLKERGRFQGYVSALWAAASMLGPVLGGVMTQHLSWRWIFWFNVPTGLVALWLVRRSLGVLPKGAPCMPIDWLSAAMLLGGLTALLLPIELLRRKEVLAGCAAQCVCFFLFMALAVLVPLRLQLVSGRSAGDAALMLLPLTLSVPAAVFVCGRWMIRSGRVCPLPQAGAALALLSPSQVLASTRHRGPDLLGTRAAAAGIGQQWHGYPARIRNADGEPFSSQA